MDDNLKQSVDILRAALTNDPGYYESWKANIAMSFYDASLEILKQDAEGIKPELHKCANEGADRFLKLLLYDGKKENYNSENEAPHIEPGDDRTKYKRKD